MPDLQGPDAPQHETFAAGPEEGQSSAAQAENLVLKKQATER